MKKVDANYFSLFPYSGLFKYIWSNGSNARIASWSHKKEVQDHNENKKSISDERLQDLL